MEPCEHGGRHPQGGVIKLWIFFRTRPSLTPSSPQPNPQATLPQASTNYVLRVCEGKSTKDSNADSIIIMMGHI